MALHTLLVELTEHYPHLLTFTFWDDLKQNGIDLPILLPLLIRELKGDPSGTLRMIADYIDARKAPKGDRGARLQATEKLYNYAFLVLTGKAKELNWSELKQKFCTYYEDDENWQKFLRDRGIPFRGVGRPRGAAVQNRKKNTGRRACIRMTGNRRSRRDRNNAENRSRPRT